MKAKQGRGCSTGAQPRWLSCLTQFKHLCKHGVVWSRSLMSQGHKKNEETMGQQSDTELRY